MRWRKRKFAAGIGPAMLNAGDSEAEADLLANILSATKHICGSIVVAEKTACAGKRSAQPLRAIKRLEDETEHSHGNFNLGAIAMVPPLSPFFHRCVSHRIRTPIRRLDWNPQMSWPLRSKTRRIWKRRNTG